MTQALRQTVVLETASIVPRREWVLALPAVWIVVLLITGNVLGWDIESLFDEGAAVTHSSALLLGGCGITAFFAGLRQHPRWPWILFAAGFVFLLCDELLELHERADRVIHALIGMRENAWTDRIDDVIVLGYGIAALGFVITCRRLLPPLYQEKRLFIVAGAWFAGMVVMDLASNAYPSNVAAHFSGSHIHLLKAGAAVVEETCKVMAEWALLVGFYRIAARAGCVEGNAKRQAAFSG